MSTILDFKKGKTLGQRIKQKELLEKKMANLPDEYHFLSRDIMRQGMANIVQVLEKGAMQIFEHQHHRGSNIHYYEVLLTASGKDEVLAIIRDITERRRLEKQVLGISEWES